ncbi:NAD(P)H-dependent oxidoreductase [Rubritalea marina]|uniref:NAD(P)H-dependent oxidoreductase n=1 Tax=Rubritalea marina TaxID=361055 RepID=UPI000376B319|nr:NAD(P)H-dependent oxidoreductase [Rubritalea marina]
MPQQEILDALHWRYATKAFDQNKKISSEDLDKLVQSLVLTPSSFGLQPWKFIVVESLELKQSLLPFSWNQTQVVNCDKLIVLAAYTAIKESDVDAFSKSIAESRGIDLSDITEYRDLMAGFIARMDEEQLSAWAKNQVYIALGQVMTTAAVLGIDACPMEGISPKDYDRLLGLEDSGYTTTLACPVGYRSADDKYAELPKVRYSVETLVSYQ